MKAIALATLTVLTSTGSCGSETGPPTTAAPEQSTVRGADPGAFLPSTCLGQDDLRAWRRVDPMTLPVDWNPDGTWPGSHCPWSVLVREGIPIVFSGRSRHPSAPAFLNATSKGLSAVQRTSAGVLVGFNRGEWGGSLGWYSEKGSLIRQLLDSNVVGILPAFGGFVALTYQGYREGRATEIRDKSGQFEVGRTAELPRAPAAGDVDSDGTILVVTGVGLLRLSRDLRAHPVLEVDWGTLQPVSLAIGRDGIAYVGMRGLVVELQMATQPPKETWLFPF